MSNRGLKKLFEPQEWAGHDSKRTVRGKDGLPYTIWTYWCTKCRTVFESNYRLHYAVCGNCRPAFLDALERVGDHGGVHRLIADMEGKQD